MILRGRLDKFAADTRYEVAAHRMPHQAEADRHGHRFFEIVIVEGGEAIHKTEGKSHLVARGDVFILDPSRTHSYVETKGFSIINILVNESFVRRLDAEMGVLAGFHALFSLKPFPLKSGSYSNQVHLEESSLSTLLNYASQIEGLCKRTDPEGPILCHAWGRVLIAFLAAQGNSQSGEGRRYDLPRAIAKVEQSILEPLSLTDLVSQTGMSERSFLRKFREATGYSPIRYQLHCRLRYACSLLLDTDLYITEIAMSCGFQDSNYFSRQFSRFYGQSPREWRRAQR